MVTWENAKAYAHVPVGWRDDRTILFERPVKGTPEYYELTLDPNLWNGAQAAGRAEE